MVYYGTGLSMDLSGTTVRHVYRHDFVFKPASSGQIGQWFSVTVIDGVCYSELVEDWDTYGDF